MLWNALRLAFGALRRNVLRSSLTMLGVVIGVAAVITMVTIGNGATVAITNQIEAMGSDLVIIVPGSGMGAGRAPGEPFDVDDAEALRDQVASVRAVAPTARRGAYAVYGNENWSTQVTGIDAGYLEVRDWAITEGRAFLASEYRAGSTVCIIGETLNQELMRGYAAIGERIRVGSLSCEVVGLLESKGQNTFGQDQDNTVLIPLRAFHRRISGDTDVSMIMASAASAASVHRAVRDIEYLMRERRRIGAGEDDDFAVRTTQELSDALTGATRIMTALLGAVAAVSLLVGGIGIMNIMLVSVTERTREIGTRLAIGALERDVLTQFLVEAAVLSSLGGVVGIGLAIGASAGLTRVFDIPLVVDPGIIGLAFAFSAAVGLVFGFFPARRAARLDPIEALRRE